MRRHLTIQRRVAATLRPPLRCALSLAKQAIRQPGQQTVNRPSGGRGLLAGLLLAAVPTAAPVQGQDEPSQQVRDPRWQEIYRDEAKGYRFETVAAPPQRLAMQPQSVMQWVSLNDFNGDVFVWTLNGHPEVVGTIFSRPIQSPDRRTVMHEFHSFAAQPIQAAGVQGKPFAFDQPTELKLVPQAPVPADNPARLYLQARALAKQFSAHMERQGQRWELRLLSQPLYRYDKTSDEVLGGAVFTFVGFVTDPEVLLLIEARKTAAGPAWSYAAARFSDKSLWLNHKGTEVWKYRRDAPAVDGRYYFFPGRTIGLASDQP